MMDRFEDIKLLATKGRISRREFVQLAVATGITVTAAEAMFITAARAEPKRGGFCRLGFAHGSSTDNLDPAFYSDTFRMAIFWGALSNGLMVVNAHGEIEGDLAQSIEPIDGARSWIVKLRKGVTFHNGKDLTADDVIASYQHHMKPDSQSIAVSSVSSIAELKADGPDTVVFTLKEANADFPYLTSDPAIPIMPSKDGVADWQSGVRTGAFSLERFDPGVSAKLKRNPNYHKEGRPYFDEIEALPLTDTVARTNALITGEIDWMGRADLRTLNVLERNDNVAITEVTGLGHFIWAMLCDVPPFNDANVRLALKHAVDREDVLKKIFTGHAAIGNDNPILPPPSIPYAIDPQPRHTYDPDKAKAYLRKAGLSSLKVDLSTADVAFPGAVDAAVLFREHAAKCGIDINVVREANDGYWENVWSKKPFSGTYSSGRPTCDWMLSLAYLSTSSQNETHWNNPHFDKIIVAARGEVDQGKRAAMYAEAQQLVHDDSGAIILVFRNYVDAHSRKLSHGELGRNWEVDGLRLAERWWFA